MKGLDFHYYKSVWKKCNKNKVLVDFGFHFLKFGFEAVWKKKKKKFNITFYINEMNENFFENFIEREETCFGVIKRIKEEFISGEYLWEI